MSVSPVPFKYNSSILVKLEIGEKSFIVLLDKSRIWRFLNFSKPLMFLIPKSANSSFSTLSIAA